MTDLAGHPALLNLANSPSVFLVIPLLPVLITFCFWYYSLHVDESDRTSRDSLSSVMHVILLCTLAAWWALWDFQSGSGPIPTLAFGLERELPGFGQASFVLGVTRWRSCRCPSNLLHARQNISRTAMDLARLGIARAGLHAFRYGNATIMGGLNAYAGPSRPPRA